LFAWYRFTLFIFPLMLFFVLFIFLNLRICCSCCPLKKIRICSCFWISEFWNFLEVVVVYSCDGFEMGLPWKVMESYDEGSEFMDEGWKMKIY
jgi:hypothetical protein